MAVSSTREKLREQIDSLPDEIVQQIADFTSFIAKNQELLGYSDWEDKQWQRFVLAQFFSEDDEVEYSIDDAKEIYHL